MDQSAAGQNHGFTAKCDPFPWFHAVPGTRWHFQICPINFSSRIFYQLLSNTRHVSVSKYFSIWCSMHLCTTRQKRLCLSLTLNIYNFIVLPKIYSETTPNLLLLPIFWPCVCCRGLAGSCTKWWV